MQLRPVLYLDLDDTVISWSTGSPAGGAGLRDFLLWALDTFEVRWLTRWARDGVMQPRLLDDLARMTDVPVERLARVRGLSWDQADCKLDGIAWLEHIVLERPFLWIEDETIGDHVLAFLAAHGFATSYRRCNVTKQSDAIHALHDELRAVFAPHANGNRAAGTRADAGR